MEALKRKIESGELTTLLTLVHEYCQASLKSSPVYDEQHENGVFSYSLHSANTQRYFGHHEHKKQAKLLVARDFLRNEAPELLKLFDNKMSNDNGRKLSVSKLLQTPVTDSGFGKTSKARTPSAITAPHPYSRLSPNIYSDPHLDRERRSVAVFRVLGEIDRGEVITACDAFESLQEGLGLPHAAPNCSQLGNRMFCITIDDGNRIYGQGQHALKPQAKLLAYEDAIRSIAPDIWSRLRANEFESYLCSNRQFHSNEDVLHEYISRNFRTSVAFNTAGNDDSGGIVMQARIFGILIGSGCNPSIKIAQSDAIDCAISNLCSHLIGLLTPRDPRLYKPQEANSGLYLPPSPTSQSYYETVPEPYYAAVPQEILTAPSLMHMPLSKLPMPPIPNMINHEVQRQLPNVHVSRERLIKPMDFAAPPSSAVRSLMERIDQGSIPTLFSLLAAYLQLVERTTPVFDVKTQSNGSFRCDIVINGKSLGTGESLIKKQAKTVACRNVLQSLCPELVEQFQVKYPNAIPE